MTTDNPPQPQHRPIWDPDIVSLANLHTTERQLYLSRRTCTITNDNIDMIFVIEVQPKPTFLRHDYRRSSPTAAPAAIESRHHAVFSLRACRYVVMVTTTAHFSYLWGVSNYRVWHRLYLILLIQLKSYRNRPVHIFDTIANNTMLILRAYLGRKVLEWKDREWREISSLSRISECEIKERWSINGYVHILGRASFIHLTKSTSTYLMYWSLSDIAQVNCHLQINVAVTARLR
jgi:hypothetical protein